MQVLKNASRDEVLEHALKAKEEAIEINYRLENENRKLKDQVRRLNGEMKRLNEENGIYKRLVYWWLEKELRELKENAMSHLR